MLSTFIVKRHFNQLKVVLYVDCEKRDAEITLTYQRRVRHVSSVAFHDVSTPEAAEKWLSRTSVGLPEHGSMIEALEAQYRLGFGIGGPNVVPRTARQSNNAA